MKYANISKKKKKKYYNYWNKHYKYFWYITLYKNWKNSTENLKIRGDYEEVIFIKNVIILFVDNPMNSIVLKILVVLMTCRRYHLRAWHGAAGSLGLEARVTLATVLQGVGGGVGHRATSAALLAARTAPCAWEACTAGRAASARYLGAASLAREGTAAPCTRQGTATRGQGGAAQRPSQPDEHKQVHQKRWSTRKSK